MNSQEISEVVRKNWEWDLGPLAREICKDQLQCRHFSDSGEGCDGAWIICTAEQVIKDRVAGKVVEIPDDCPQLGAK